MFQTWNSKVVVNVANTPSGNFNHPKKFCSPLDGSCNAYEISRSPLMDSTWHALVLDTSFYADCKWHWDANSTIDLLERAIGIESCTRFDWW